MQTVELKVEMVGIHEKRLRKCLSKLKGIYIYMLLSFLATECSQHDRQLFDKQSQIMTLHHVEAYIWQSYHSTELMIAASQNIVFI